MILGFKTGPKNFEEGQRIVTELGASMCEVWFNVTQHKEYKDMLAWLGKHGVGMGLHHWGVIDGNKKTNLATNNEHIRNETIAQVKKTIDIGADIGCVYVNVHPGAQALETIDFTNWKQTMLDDELTPAEQSRDLLLAAAAELHQYATEKNVTLTFESITAREAVQSDMREQVYNPGNTTLASMELLQAQGNLLANDISHLGTQLLVDGEDPNIAWEKAMDFSRRTAPATRLIHLNVITPPYNGTDSHDCITDEDFAQETFPSKEGFIDFLTLFTDRDDVYAVPEPKQDVTQNYLALKAFAESL